MDDEEASEEVRVDLVKQNPKLSTLAVDDLNAAVTHLNVSENQLPTLPPAISSLQKLRVINASDNQLTSLPDEIGDCVALEELLLFKNQLKKLPSTLGKLKSLRVLNLFNNKLMSFPGSLGQCTELEEVNAAANKLALLSDESLAGWGRVKILNLYDNNLVKVGNLAPLTSLVELRVYNNNLEALPALPAICPLELLEAHNNRLASVDDDYFASAPRLRRLLLAGNQLTALPASLSRSCARLQFLQVGGNQIGELSMEPRRTMLDDTALLDDAAALLCWPELETLFLEQNPIAALPPELPRCTKLLRCNLSGTKLADGDAVVAAMLKLVLARPGGSFWSVNGRRWMSDEARAASFANQKCAPAHHARRSAVPPFRPPPARHDWPALFSSS